MPRSPTAAGCASWTPSASATPHRATCRPSSRWGPTCWPTTSACSSRRAWSAGTGRRPTGGGRILRLDPDALAGLGPGVPTVGHPVRRVVFVCTANTARSQLAAALWSRSSRVPATSAGTHPADAVAAGAVAVAERHGLRLTRVTPRHVEDVLRHGDFVVTVCDNAHEELDRGAAASRTPRPPAACTGRSRTRSPPAPARPSTPPTTSWPGA